MTITGGDAMATLIRAEAGERGGQLVLVKGSGHNFNLREREVLLILAEQARTMAKATGSRAATQRETLFGIDFEVTWHRSGPVWPPSSEES